MDRRRRRLQGRPEGGFDERGRPSEDRVRGPRRPFRRRSELDVVDVSVREGKTTAPKPYTDATLLSAMEHAGRMSPTMSSRPPSPTTPPIRAVSALPRPAPTPSSASSRGASPSVRVARSWRPRRERTSSRRSPTRSRRQLSRRSGSRSCPRSNTGGAPSMPSLRASRGTRGESSARPSKSSTPTFSRRPRAVRAPCAASRLSRANPACTSSASTSDGERPRTVRSTKRVPAHSPSARSRVSA